MYTETILDVASNEFPLYFICNPEFRLTNWSTPYRFDVWDEDLTGWEHIGYTTFTVQNIINTRGYVTEYLMTSGRLQIRITLRWQ